MVGSRKKVLPYRSGACLPNVNRLACGVPCHIASSKASHKPAHGLPVTAMPPVNKGKTDLVEPWHVHIGPSDRTDCIVEMPTPLEHSCTWRSQATGWTVNPGRVQNCHLMYCFILESAEGERGKRRREQQLWGWERGDGKEKLPRVCLFTLSSKQGCASQHRNKETNCLWLGRERQRCEESISAAGSLFSWGFKGKWGAQEKIA